MSADDHNDTKILRLFRQWIAGHRVAQQISKTED
jgi:hypothetical protein